MKLRLLLLLVSSSVLASTCPDLATARRAYQAGAKEDALAALECLRREYPEDLEVRRMLSDIHWWEGDADRAVSEAAAIDADGELGLAMRRRAARFRLATAFDALWTDGQSGTEQRLDASTRYSGKSRFGIGVARVTKLFQSGIPITAMSYSAEHVSSHGIGYLEARAAISPERNLLPSWSGALEPHAVLGDFDLSVGLGVNRYENATVYWLGPQAQWTLDPFTLTLRLVASSVPEWLWVPQARIEYAFSSMWSARLSGAGGRVLEAPGLLGGFFSTGLDVKYQVLSELALRAGFTAYRGDVRSENRIAFGADWIF